MEITVQKVLATLRKSGFVASKESTTRRGNASSIRSGSKRSAGFVTRKAGKTIEVSEEGDTYGSISADKLSGYADALNAAGVEARVESGRVVVNQYQGELAFWMDVKSKKG